MRLGIVESYYGGSHRLWADGIRRMLKFDVDLYTLSDHHWKWRMHGGAVSLAREVVAAFNAGRQPDLLIVTSMTDLTVFRSLLTEAGIRLPVLYYFHENQLSYPWSPDDPDVSAKRDRHYGFIHLASALAADHVFFNSEWHRQSFCEAIPRFCAAFPKPSLADELQRIEAKSSVLHLGLDVKHLIEYPRDHNNGTPRLLWNHRWEYDKSPEAFFNALYDLDAEDVPFELIVSGESFEKVPTCFAEARKRLQHRIVHFGYTRDRSGYEQLLMKADILPVTSAQDFFGISVVEAMASGAWPLLPGGRVYSEHEGDAQFTYPHGDFTNSLRSLIQSDRWRRGYSGRVKLMKYDWLSMAPVYEQRFSDIFHTFQGNS